MLKEGTIGALLLLLLDYDLLLGFEGWADDDDDDDDDDDGKRTV